MATEGNMKLLHLFCNIHYINKLNLLRINIRIEFHVCLMQQPCVTTAFHLQGVQHTVDLEMFART